MVDGDAAGVGAFGAEFGRRGGEGGGEEGGEGEGSEQAKRGRTTPFGAERGRPSPNPNLRRRTTPTTTERGEASAKARQGLAGAAGAVAHLGAFLSVAVRKNEVVGASAKRGRLGLRFPARSEQDPTAADAAARRQRPSEISGDCGREGA